MKITSAQNDDVEMHSEHDESEDEYEGTYAHQKAESDQEEEFEIEVWNLYFNFLVYPCSGTKEPLSANRDSRT